MTIRQLEQFMAVAKHLSFSAASKQLYISQPALSRSISSLEAELGVSLLLRDTHSVRLTPAGIVLAAAIPKLKTELDLTVDDVRQANDGVRGTLKIGIVEGVYPAAEFSGVIDYFRRSLPFIELDIRCMSENAITQATLSHELDIYYMYFPTGQIPVSLNTMLLCDEAVRIAASSQHFSWHGDSVDLHSLKDESFVFCCSESSVNIHRWRELCSFCGFIPKLIFVENHDTLCFYVEHGHAIAALPESDRIFDSSRIIGAEINEEFTLSCTAAWNADNHNPSVNLFTRLLSGDICSD